MNLLPELNALVLIHDRPDVTEAAVVDGAFDDDGNDTGEHETSLNHVRPHHSFHTTLETQKETHSFSHQRHSRRVEISVFSSTKTTRKPS